MDHKEESRYHKKRRLVYGMSIDIIRLYLKDSSPLIYDFYHDGLDESGLRLVIRGLHGINLILEFSEEQSFNKDMNVLYWNYRIKSIILILNVYEETGNQIK